MRSTAEWVVDIFILAAVTTYTLTALCCIYAMWHLRKQFVFATRSPLLGCWIGTATSLRCCSGVYVFTLQLHGWRPDGFAELSGIPAGLEVIFAPATLVSVGAMISWVLRLLVLYDPEKRRKWGRFLNEKRIFRTLVVIFALLEVGAWAIVGINGLARTAYDAMSLVDLTSMLLAIAAAATFGGRLRKIDDICNVSSDISRLGALELATIVAFAIIFSVRMSPRVFKYVLASMFILSLQPFAWMINIRPIRDYLQRQEGVETRNGLLLLLLPWAWVWKRVNGAYNRRSRVAVCEGSPHDASKSHHAPRTRTRLFVSSASVGESPLAFVMDFVPLKEAFGEYCRKALCSESYQFLIDALEFEDVVRASSGVDETSNKDGFNEFTAIVDEYIRDSSNSEINIDSSTKKLIMKCCDRPAYTSLTQEERQHVFLRATKEIVKLLADNLLQKFKLTEEYRAIVADTDFEESAN